MSDPFYITTAISYPNGPPHIGHAYEAIATDVIARFQRLAGREVFFLTGTDEHGLKMAQAARDRGIEPIALAGEMSALFRKMDDRFNISYDRFIRTTEPDHARASQAIWQAMVDRGDIYLGRYEGWYSVRDEAFYDEKELVAADSGEKLSPQGTLVEWTVEESWFFRLSAYQERLLDHYRANPDFIRPEARRNEVMRFVEGGLSDLSVSRTSFDWGVKVPGSENHVMYVWVDALTNYLTGVGYPDNTDAYGKFWPADIHIIGKDIVRFHAVYWPAFLMSAGLPLPQSVFGHGFVLHRGEKMSKSLGNVVDPHDLADAFGVDPVRYFLLREVTFGQDGSYSEEAIVNRVNADLANSFGNLAQRTLSFIAKNCGGELPVGGRGEEADAALRELVGETVRTDVPGHFSVLMLSQGIEAWLKAVFACNQYIDAQAPWALRKSDPERMKAVLATLYVAIGDLALSISPVIPESCARLLDQMGIPSEERSLAALADGERYSRLAASGFRLEPPTPIFPRLDAAASRAMFVDSHCHLNYKGLVETQQAVLERARAAGVATMLNISTRASEWDEVIGVAERESDVWASVGIHPHEADAHPDVQTATLVERAAHPRVVGIGESGLDYYYDHSDRERQRTSFRAHLAAARETGLPIIVHTRDAEDDTAEILTDEMGKGAYPGVIHCFTASADFARKALDLGLYISISGIVTFKNAKDLQETAKSLPADRLLIETDSPFLAPVPHRGKPCEPAFVADTARFLATLRGESVEELAERTSVNFQALFSKVAS